MTEVRYGPRSENGSLLSGIDLLATYEGAFMGLQWNEVADDDFAMSTILLLLLGDFFFYSFLAW